MTKETHAKEESRSTIEKSIEVNVPVRTAYNQWTQFEEFPRFMEGVRSHTAGCHTSSLESSDRGPGKRVGCGDH